MLTVLLFFPFFLVNVLYLVVIVAVTLVSFLFFCRLVFRFCYRS